MPVNQTISTKELRENFDFVRSVLASGQSLTLIYRSKPIARLKPIESAVHSGAVSIRRLAGGVKLKTQLKPKELNRLYNRSLYDK